VSIIKEIKSMDIINVVDNLPTVKPLPLITRNTNIFNKYWKLFQPRKWKLTKNYVLPLKNISILVPSPFELDFASVPRIFWPIMSPTGILLVPAVVHDFGYKYGGIIILTENNNIIFVKMTRLQIDEVFKLLTIKINDITAGPIIAEKMVNCFGWMPWNEYRKEDNDVLKFYPYIKRIVTE